MEKCKCSKVSHSFYTLLQAQILINLCRHVYNFQILSNHGLLKEAVLDSKWELLMQKLHEVSKEFSAFSFHSVKFRKKRMQLRGTVEVKMRSGRPRKLLVSWS